MNSIVTKMRFQQNVYNELFTEELRMKYFIDEANMEDRCRIMLQDKAWAGFPEKIAAAIFMGQNLFECYKQQNESFHWNVFLGSMDPGVLEENNLEWIELLAKFRDPDTYPEDYMHGMKLHCITLVIKATMK